MSVVDNHPARLTTLQKRDWVAGHILYTNHLYAALAGPPTAAFYGSDTLWTHIILLINDPSFEDACRILHDNGYNDVPIDEHDFKTMQPPDLDPDGKKAVKWRLLSPKECHGNGGATILVPASHWHFKATDDTTIIVDGMCLPRFSSYLHALVSLVGQRVRSSIPAGYYELQTMDIWVLREKYPDSLKEVSPATLFFLEHFFSVRRMNSRKKVVELWDGLNQGTLTVEEAVGLVPIETNPRYQSRDFPVVSMNIGLADK